MAVAGYEYRKDGGSPVDVGNVLSINVTGLSEGTSYDFEVRAYDEAGNRSAWSPVLAVTTDTTPAPVLIYRQDLGRTSGGVVSGWSQDTIMTSGAGFTLGGSPDKTGLTDPAPDAVYLRIQYTSATPLTGTISGLTPNVSHHLRFHFYVDSGSPYGHKMTVGGRPGFELVSAVNSKAYIKEMYIDADGSGEIDFVLDFVLGSITFVSGIEVYEAVVPANSVTKQIIVEGDSIATSWNTHADSWPNQLATLRDGNSYDKEAIEQFDSGNLWSVRNASRIGDTLLSAVTQAADDVDYYYDSGLTENILVLHMGSNDLAGQTATYIEDTIEAYCLDRQAAGWDVYVGTLLPRTDITGANETKRTDVNTWLIANYAGFCTAIIDFAGHTDLDDASNATYFFDGVHPTSAAKAIMAGMVDSALPA